MEDDEFLKEHPSLKGTAIVVMHSIVRDLIHKTQLDKQKVKEAISIFKSRTYTQEQKFIKELGLK